MISADARDWIQGGQEVVGVRLKIIERIVMDETGTCVVQSVRRVPEEQRLDNRLSRVSVENRTQAMCQQICLR